MSWRQSLVRISEFQVEELRKRLAAVTDRRVEAEMKLVLLHAEAEAESRRSAQDVEAGWYRVGYLEGWRARRDATLLAIETIKIEEAGARDAVAEAFAELKKYEQLEENAQLADRRAEAKRETAELDQLGLRRAS